MPNCISYVQMFFPDRVTNGVSKVEVRLYMMELFCQNLTIDLKFQMHFRSNKAFVAMVSQNSIHLHQTFWRKTCLKRTNGVSKLLGVFYMMELNCNSV